jgi:hypothetical protein
LDVGSYAVYSAPSGNSVKFLSDIDAGLIEPIGITSIFSFLLPPPVMKVGLPDGDWQFAVCAYDETGNFSNPHQSVEWVNVKIKMTPPRRPEWGGLD